MKHYFFIFISFLFFYTLNAEEKKIDSHGQYEKIESINEYIKAFQSKDVTKINELTKNDKFIFHEVLQWAIKHKPEVAQDLIYINQTYQIIFEPMVEQKKKEALEMQKKIVEEKQQEFAKKTTPLAFAVGLAGGIVGGIAGAVVVRIFPVK